MIIVHEGLPREASQVADVFGRVYGLSSLVVDKNLDSVFNPLTAFNGFWLSEERLWMSLQEEYKDKQVLVVTPRDIYTSNVSQDDDWVFGYAWANVMVASTARMKRPDNKPSRRLEVPEDLYMRRLETLAVHEVGHSVCDAPHYQQAVWVNTRTGHEQRLGPHCNDNKCVMYEVVDIQAPPAEQGHLLL